MTIKHIVLFHFKPELSAADQKDACTRMLNLKTECLNPTTKAPYIKSIEGGKQISIEPVAVYTHAFVVEFENEADRDFYVKEDPAHTAFKKFLMGGRVEKAGVVDFVPGEY